MVHGATKMRASHNREEFCGTVCFPHTLYHGLIDDLICRRLFTTDQLNESLLPLWSEALHFRLKCSLLQREESDKIFQSFNFSARNVQVVICHLSCPDWLGGLHLFGHTVTHRKKVWMRLMFTATEERVYDLSGPGSDVWFVPDPTPGHICTQKSICSIAA